MTASSFRRPKRNIPSSIRSAPEDLDVAAVAHALLPRRARALPGEVVDRALDVAGGEVEQRAPLELRVVVAWDGDRVAAGVHVGEEAAEVLGDDVDLERPRGVDVADGEGEVGHVREHESLVGKRLRQPDLPAVNHQLDAAEGLQVEARCGHDHVGLESRARRELEPVLGERLDGVSDDRRASGADRLEQVGVGDHAEPLVPRVVARPEMGVDRVPLRQVALGVRADDLPRQPWVPPAECVDPCLQHDVLAPRECVAALLAQVPMQRVGETVDGWEAEDVAGRALQHRHVLGHLGHGGDDRDRGGPAADDHNALALVVELRGPALWVDDLSAEALGACERRIERLVVAVVAAGREQPIAGERQRLTRVGAPYVDGPAPVLARELGALDGVVEADLAVDAVLACRFADVVEDRRTVGDRLLSQPRFECVPEGVQVGVGADTRIAEEVPRPADRVTRLEDGEGALWVLLLQVVGHADAGDTGAHDDHVEVVGELARAHRIFRRHLVRSVMGRARQLQGWCGPATIARQRSIASGRPSKATPPLRDRVLRPDTAVEQLAQGLRIERMFLN